MVIWKKKDSGYVDLSGHMRKQQARLNNFKTNVSESDEENVPVKNESSGGGFFGFFGGGNSSTETSTSTPSYSSVETENSDEKRSKLAKRLMNMTSKIEDMENEIYQLKQKIEVLEKKQRLDY